MSWNSKVQIFNSVPFDLKNNHTRYFDNKTQQTNYFNNLGGTLTITNNRYVRIDTGVYDIEKYADTIDNVNYAIIENINTENNTVRKYFVFITEVEFINANLTRLHFEVDVLQTYMFDLNFQQSFVERQHLNTTNKVSENLDIGSDYINISSTLHGQTIDNHFNTMLVVATQDLMDDSNPTNVGTMVSGVASPLVYYLVLVPKVSGEYTINFNGEQIQQGSNMFKIFTAFNREESANKIVGISYLPVFPYSASLSKSGNVYTITSKSGVSPNNLLPWPILDGSYKTILINVRYGDFYSNYINQNVKSTINSYMNNNGITQAKLRQYPFVRVVLRDNLGSQFEIKPEHLDGNNLQVDMLPSVSSVPKVAYRIKNYKTGKNLTNAIISSINADVEIINDYTATYLQGRKNSDQTALRTGLAGGLTQTALGFGITAASGWTGIGAVAGIGTMTGGLTNIFSQRSQHNAKMQDIERIPPTLQNQAGASNINIGYGYSLPQVDIEVCDIEYLKRAENYMKEFGYAVKDVTTLNLKTRTRFNFIKTIGCNVTGKVPQKHLDKVRNIFDSGVTLWHVNDMYNYTPANNVR